MMSDRLREILRRIAERNGWDGSQVQESCTSPPPVKPAARPAAKAPAVSVCRDCGRRASVSRYSYFKATRPRCVRCGGTLEYGGSWYGTR